MMSSRPAHQYGQAPTGTAPPSLTGQPNTFEVPCAVYSKPNTMRKTLKTVGVKRFSGAAESFVMLLTNAIDQMATSAPCSVARRSPLHPVRRIRNRQTTMRPNRRLRGIRTIRRSSLPATALVPPGAPLAADEQAKQKDRASDNDTTDDDSDTGSHPMDPGRCPGMRGADIAAFRFVSCGLG